jgi:hypothetical protein
MVCSDEDRGRCRRPGAEDRGRLHRSVLSGRVIERSGGTVCGLHHAHGDEVCLRSQCPVWHRCSGAVSS